MSEDGTMRVIPVDAILLRWAYNRRVPTARAKCAVRRTRLWMRGLGPDVAKTLMPRRVCAELDWFLQRSTGVSF